MIFGNHFEFHALNLHGNCSLYYNNKICTKNTSFCVYSYVLNTKMCCNMVIILNFGHHFEFRRPFWFFFASQILLKLFPRCLSLKLPLKTNLFLKSWEANCKKWWYWPPSCIMAAILNCSIWQLDTRTKIIPWTIIYNLVRKNKLSHEFEMTEWLCTPLI